MVLILSDNENKSDKEIEEILRCFGAAVVSDAEIFEASSNFTVVGRHSIFKISAEKGVVIATDSIKKFKNQYLPSGFIGVCAENNKNALKLFKRNRLSVITCGVGTKNTLSVSSIEQQCMLLCLQRNITDVCGLTVEPCEIKMNLSKDRNLFSILAAASVALYYRLEFKNGNIDI